MKSIFKKLQIHLVFVFNQILFKSTFSIEFNIVKIEIMQCLETKIHAIKVKSPMHVAALVLLFILKLLADISAL